MEERKKEVRREGRRVKEEERSDRREETHRFGRGFVLVLFTSRRLSDPESSADGAIGWRTTEEEVERGRGGGEGGRVKRVNSVKSVESV